MNGRAAIPIPVILNIYLSSSVLFVFNSTFASYDCAAAGLNLIVKVPLPIAGIVDGGALTTVNTEAPVPNLSMVNYHLKLVLVYLH